MTLENRNTVPTQQVAGNSTEIEVGHTYNAFSGREFYRRVDKYAIDKIAGHVSKVIIPGIGDGENIKGLIEQGKLSSDFFIVATDIDRSALVDTSRSLGNFNGEDYSSHLALAHSTADEYLSDKDPKKESAFPVKDGWADLQIGLNMIHLLDHPQHAFNQMARTSKPGAQIIVSTTYEYERAKLRHKETNRFLGLVIAGTKRKLLEMGYDVKNPKDVARYTEEEYINMARNAGFVNVEVENYEAFLDKNDFRAIFSYNDFLEGAFPGIPPEVTRPIVTGRVDEKTGEIILPGEVDFVGDRFAERGIIKFQRDWMIITAMKPLGQAPDAPKRLKYVL